MKEGTVVKAMYDFKTNVAGELQLKKGDVIQITDLLDQHWARGVCDRGTGSFPVCFVQEIPLPQYKAGQVLFVASNNFPAMEQGDLSFNKGDIILGVSPVDSNWWRGECNGFSGIFPVTHVWQIKMNLLKEPPKSVNIKARVKVDMKAQLDEEMDLNLGDIITITEIIDKDWYKGTCNESSGIFPSDFVDIIDDNSALQPLPDICDNIKKQSFSKSSNLNTISEVDNKISTDTLSSGYHSQNSGITPYGRTLYPFIAQYPDELSFNAGEIIKLIRHVDGQWLECEIDNKIGFCPKSYINIIVDCSNTKLIDNSSDFKDDSFIEIIPGVTQARVIYDYFPQTSGDLTLVEGELITIISKPNADWFEAKDSQGICGLCPANYLTVLPNNQSVKEYNNNKAEIQMPNFMTDIKNSQISQGQTAVTEIGQNGFNLSGYSESINNSRKPTLTANSASEVRIYPKYDFTKPRCASDSKTLDNIIAKNLASLDTTFHSDRNSWSGTPGRSTSLSESRKSFQETSTVPNQGIQSFSKSKPIFDSNSRTPLKPLSTDSGNDSSKKQPKLERIMSLEPPPRPAPPVIKPPSESQKSFELSSASSVVTSDAKYSLSTPPPIPPPPLIPMDAINSSPSPSPPPQKVEHSRINTQESEKYNSFNSVNFPMPIRPAPLPPPTVVSRQQLDSVPSATSSSAVTDNLRRPHRPAPPVPLYPVSACNTNQNSNDPAVRELQRQITEREKNLQQLQNVKMKLERHSSQDYGSQDTMQDQVKDYEKTIDGLSSEIQVLKESYSRITMSSDTEVGALPTTNNILQPEKSNEEAVANERKRKLEIRGKVIEELIQTERDYLNDLKLLYVSFLENPEEGKSKGIEVELLFGNLEQVIEVSENLLKALEKETIGSEPHDIMIGKCFKYISEEMKEVYGQYCSNHEEVIHLLEKYSEMPVAQDYIAAKTELIRKRIPCLNIGSLLIKPVQRILKYPLLLNELIKATEIEHGDMSDLQEAIQLMTDVATAINEFKRQKDLVVKYRQEEDTSLSSLISKISLHSMGKKATRFGMRLSSSIGLTSVTKDEAFDEEEHKFRSLEKAVRTFLKDLANFCIKVEEYAQSQFHSSEDISDFYMEERYHSVVDEFRIVHHKLNSTLLPDFKNIINKFVVEPLSSLVHTFQGPSKLIEKRHDKLLDYDSSTLRLEKNKDISKTKMLREEQLEMKKTYEALNNKLLEDLPKLFTLGLAVFRDCVIYFVAARKQFLGQMAKLILPLAESSSLHCLHGDPLDAYYYKMMKSSSQLALLSFIPNNFFPIQGPELTKEKQEKKQKHTSLPSALGSKSSQSKAHRTQVQKQYTKEQLFCSIKTFSPSDQFEVALNIGDVVGVIKQQDPMGNPERWFVDTGAVKGFVPKHCLSPMSPRPSPKSSPLRQNRRTSQPVNNINVAPEYMTLPAGFKVGNASPTPSGRSTGRSSSFDSHQTLRGPTIIRSQMGSHIESTGQLQPIIQQPMGIQESTRRSPQGMIPPPQTSLPSVAPQPPHLYGNLDLLENLDFQSGERYDIPYESPDQMPTASRDLYDEVADDFTANLTSSSSCYSAELFDTLDSRNAATASPNSSFPQHNEGSNTVKEFYYAAYEFRCSSSSELSLALNQVVLVLQKQDMEGNKEWWYVQDRYGNQGYAPANYLVKYERK